MGLDIGLLVLGVLGLVFGIAGLMGKVRIPIKYQGRSWTAAYGRDMSVAEVILGVFWIAGTLITGFVAMEQNVRTIVLIGSLVPGLAYGAYVAVKYRKMLKDDIQ